MLLWNIFFLFTRVAMFSWGGGPASLGLMQRETISAGWLSPSDFADAVALGNALPGPIAPQVAAYIGYQLDGIPGAVAAATGTVLPTTLLMLLMVIFFFGVKDSPAVRAMLAAVRPVVVGLLLWTAYDMAQAVFAIPGTAWPSALVQGWDKVLISLTTFAVLTFTGVNPALVILAAALLGLGVYRKA
ncbi:MAG: chromate transporter [Anaerolineales bacterium]|jgi:chromate transporter